MEALTELNIDGLAGPSHHYAGLAAGNLASTAHAGAVSNPRGAALQGITKMRLLLSLGVPQALFPPHPRPALKFLDAAGVKGNAREKLANAPEKLLSIAYSSAAMWAANAATVLPSVDCASSKLTLIPANLSTNTHRALEADITASQLKTLLPFAEITSVANAPDEGAANHMRLSNGNEALHLLVYGTQGSVHPARQSKEASAYAADFLKTPFRLLAQTAKAIDAGVFHNDVIATSHGALLFYHEDAFDALPPLPAWVKARKITPAELTLEEAVTTYFFNSQLVTAADGNVHWIAPAECANHARAYALLTKMPVHKFHFVDLTQSMQNGGGPACLRLRVPLSKAELAQTATIHTAYLDTLEALVTKHYRDRVTHADLRDYAFLEECYRSCEAIYGA